jgi:hypothetical protein
MRKEGELLLLFLALFEWKYTSLGMVAVLYHLKGTMDLAHYKIEKRPIEYF